MFGQVQQSTAEQKSTSPDYRFSALKLRRNVLICMVKVCYDYRSHTEKETRSPSGHKNALYVNPRPGGGLSHLRHGGGQNDPPSNSKTRKARRPDDTAIDSS